MLVRTEKEFERALKNKESQIIYEGPEAQEILQKFQEAEEKRLRTRNWGLGIGILCLLAAPFTAGGSLLGLSATVGAVALSDTVILAIISAVVTISVEAMRNLKDYLIEKDKNRIILTKKS